jgi:prolyl oligopeptidase
MFRFLPSRLAACLLLLQFLSPAFAQNAQPTAPVREVIEDYFGTKVVDPYRWMEDLKSKETQDWMRGQADFAAAYMKKLPSRDEIFRELQDIWGSLFSGIDYSKLKPGKTVFYPRLNANDETPKLYRRGADGVETLLVDAEKRVGADGKHQSIAYFVPSPDDRYVVYALAAGGSEQQTIYVFDTQSGRDLSDQLTNVETAYYQPAWLPDSSGFFYVQRQKLSKDAPATEIYNKTRAFLHRLNTAQGQDKFIFGIETPGVNLLPTYFPSVRTYKDSKWAIVQVKKGDIDGWMLFAAPIETVGKPDTPWKRITDFDNKVSSFTVRGDEIFLKTSQDAPNFKVVKMPLAAPDFAKATVLMPESDVIINYLVATKTGLYISVLEDGRDAIYRVAPQAGSRAEKLILPHGMGAAVAAIDGGYVFETDRESDLLTINSDSWTRSSKQFYYDSRTSELTDTGVVKKGKYDDLPDYESRDIKVKARDGVMILLTVIYKKGIRLDGKNPTLIAGYGSYGTVDLVGFRAPLLPWLSRGGVYAIAHVRGGGIYGERWHRAGFQQTKPNTWRDFIDCAEYLVKAKYTSPEFLAGQGGSAGGILIGRAITERPDLFAAAIIEVGNLDTLRSETTTNGVPNIQEFGSTKTKAGFRALLAMSSYANVKDGVKYPAVLLTTGINDPRVDPWMSAKMTARLQAATTSGKPILLRIDYDAGHGIGSTLTQYIQELTDEYAFVFEQLKKVNR